MEEEQSTESLRWPWPVTHSPLYNLSNSTPTDCDYERHVENILYITVMITAPLVVILLNLTSFTPRCNSSDHHWKDYLWDIPGLIIPLNLLGSTPFRFIYCVIMSCWGGDLFQNFMDKHLFYHSHHGLLDAFDFFMLSPTVMILSQAVEYFPVFACVDVPTPLLGHVIGVFYMCLLGAKNIYSECVTVRGCSARGQLSNKDIGISLGTKSPVYLLYLVIVLWFFYSAVVDIVAFISKKSHKTGEDREYISHMNHVKSLFRRKGPISTKHINFDTLWNYLVRGLRYVLPYSPSFKYPLPFIGAVCMAHVIILQLVISWTAYEIIFADNFHRWLKEFQITVNAIEWLLPQLTGKLNYYYKDILSLGTAMEIILPMGSLMAYGLTWMFTAYMIQTFHKKLQRASRGDISFLADSEPLPSLTYRLASAMRFSAFQVAYLIFTWTLYTLILWVLSGIGLMFYYGFKDFIKQAIHLWAWAMVPMMWGAAVHHLELILCKYVFLAKRESGKFVAIRYRRLYQLLTYFLFFFNVIYGVVMCFLRVFGVFVFTVVMLFRIDHDVYMRGLEGWDTGHRTFIGYMYMEYTHNNSVLRMFVKLLQNTLLEKQKHGRRYFGRRYSNPNWSLQRETNGGDTTSEESTDRLLGDPSPPLGSGPDQKPKGTYQINCTRRIIIPDRPIISRRACNRWLVAYTLLRNPSLQGLTASRLEGRTEQLYSQHHTDYGTISVRMRRS